MLAGRRLAGQLHLLPAAGGLHVYGVRDLHLQLHVRVASGLFHDGDVPHPVPRGPGGQGQPAVQGPGGGVRAHSAVRRLLPVHLLDHQAGGKS